MTIPLLAILALVFQEGQPKPTLPPVRRVTLTLDAVPAAKALEEFTAASGFNVRYRAPWQSEMELGDRPVSLDMKETPFVEAISKFCRSHGDLSFCFDSAGASVTNGADASPLCASELFGFAVTRIDEDLSTDFSDVHRSLWIDLSVWWQPDLAVFKLVDVTIDEAVDDARTDLRIEKTLRGRPELRRAQLALALPSREARSLATLRGFIDVEVPGDVVEVNLTDVEAESFGPKKVGDYLVSGTRSEKDDGPFWNVGVEAAEKERGVIGLTEARVIREDGKRLEPGQTASSDGNRAWFYDVPGGDVKTLTFKIVTSKARLKVPFEFKDLKLPRTK